MEEARRVVTSGKRSVGGIQVGLELWNLRYGCLEEGEIRNEVWVRIIGLPISLWVPSILRRVGEECGGFLAMDPLTQRMENLWWARMLVKSNGGELPSSLEIGVKGTTYYVPLWWEVLSSFRQNSKGYQGSIGHSSGEVRGDGGARTDPQVKERVNARLEALSWTTEGTEGQVDGAGRDLIEGWIQFGSTTRFSVDGAVAGPFLTRLAEDTLGLKWARGSLPQSPSEGVILKGAGDGGVGPEVGPMGSKGKEKVSEVEIGSRFGPAVSLRKRNGPFLTHLKDFRVQSIGPSAMLRVSHSPTEFQPTDKGPSGKVCSSVQPVFYGEDNIELEFISLREKEAGRKQQVDSHYSLTDIALVEEVSMYGSLSNSGGLRDLGTPSHFILFSFGRTLDGEFFYHSRVLREACQNGNLLSF